MRTCLSIKYPRIIKPKITNGAIIRTTFDFIMPTIRPYIAAPVIQPTVLLSLPAAQPPQPPE